MTAIAGIDPGLERERAERLAELGPCPPWWRPVARRQWRRRFNAIMAMSISRATAMLRSLYSPADVAEMAIRRHPLLRLIAKAPSRETQ